MKTATGLAAAGAASGLLLATATVSYCLWTSPGPLPRPRLAWAAALRNGSRPVPPLAERSLEFPILALARVRLEDSFRHPRADGARVHHAVDIMAPRHTPVRAVADGTIARMTTHGAGGLALYQTDSSGNYSFYYAHMEAYAPGLQQGQKVRRGDVIGYVGTSGNAPESAPHLHFAIYQLGQPHRGWSGRPINPYPLLKVSAEPERKPTGGEAKPLRPGPIARLAAPGWLAAAD